MTAREIILARPKFKGSLTVNKLSHEAAQITVKTWEKAYIYAVIV